MIIKFMRSYKPGIYKRRQVFYKGFWAKFDGFLFIPILNGPRHWGGLVRVRMAAAPRPTPTHYRRHDSKTAHPLDINYNPGKIESEQVNEG